MRLYSIPANIKGLIFDIDQTLYRHDFYYDLQENLQIREYAACENISYESACEKIKEFRESAGSDGKRPSLGNTFKHFGYPIELTVKWREKLFHPEDYISRDEQLRALFRILHAKYKIIAVTNNADRIGWKTLEALGIAEYFIEVLGLDKTGVSKPHKGPFIKALEVIANKAEETVAIGDRYHIDIEIPLDMGMGGILVESMEDVYKIYRVLEDNQKS